MPGAGRSKSAEPPPETRQRTRSSAVAPATLARTRAVACSLAASGVGCAASRTMILRVGSVWPYFVTTIPAVIRSPRTASTACAIVAAALPKPIT